MIRLVRHGVAVALLLVLMTAVAASAHPSFDPNQLPSGEPVDAVLVVPHGCDPGGGIPEESGASPTVVLDLQLTDQVPAFVAHDIEGWTVERSSDGEVVRWTATDGGTSGPLEFPVTLAVEGPADEAFYLAASQECEQGSFRWIGTPEQAAEHPAVKLTPTAGEIGASEPEESGHAGLGADHGDDEHTDDGHTDDEPADPASTAEGIAAADDSADATSAGGVSWITIGVVVLVLLGAAAVLWRRR